ncbi:hypothetical protein V491_01592 [Pseudogymnoascus sp. VKM F-3775]|nr:hypothetical protein V491_01592 [Pseudogymnoascus sp. VKM F-3775]
MRITLCSYHRLHPPTIFEFPTRVSLFDVRASNSLVASILPPGLVAIFAGVAGGIAEATLKQFARHTVRPRIYYIGEFEEASGRVAKDLKKINSEGEYMFVKADLTTVKTVDEVCKNIKAKEEAINLLFLSMGVTNSVEGYTQYIPAITSHTRACFFLHLLPLLQESPSFCRVVTVFHDTKTDAIATSDLQSRNNPLRNHPATFMTLPLATEMAPRVSFVNCFLYRRKKEKEYDLSRIKKIISLLLYKPIVKPGACFLFLATSARYSAGVKGEMAGVPVDLVAAEIDRDLATGVYSVKVITDAESAKTRRT